MQYTQFGQTDLKVSRLCLGTMTFSRSVDFELAGRIVDEALAAGINFIDTAESYTDSEEYVGRILQARRDRIVLATKVFTKRAHGGQAPRNSAANITESLDRSLRLLRTDHIDLYQLHHPDPESHIEETLRALDDAVQQGKIRYIGVTNHYAWQVTYMIALAQARNWHPLVSIQYRYNILDRVAETETVPMAQKFKLAVMTYAPLCGGMLSGKYRVHEAPPPDSRAASDTKVARYLENEPAFDAIEKLRPIALRNGLELNQLAILWLLAKPYLTTPIIGGSRLEHFRSIYAVAERSLPEADLREIDQLSERFIYRPFENQPFADAPIV